MLAAMVAAHQFRGVRDDVLGHLQPAQHRFRQYQAQLEGLRHDDGGAQRAQTGTVGAIMAARDDRQVGKELPGHRDHPLRGRRPVERHHQGGGLISRDAAQDLRIAAIAVVDPAAVARSWRDAAQILLEDDERDASLLEDLGNGMPDPTVGAASGALMPLSIRSPNRTRKGVAAIDSEITRSAVV